MTRLARELIALDVPEGVAMESQSGIQMGRPRVYGALVAPGSSRAGVIVMHPASNFMGHYVLEPLAERGIDVLALNSRYVNNDTTLIMERVIQDLGAGVRYMRERGVDRLALIGNSGGGALACFYQAQAENLTLTDTPAGDPVALTADQLPRVDAIALAAAHPGRGELLTSWLDCSVADEADPLAADAEWDIYDPAVTVPFASTFVGELRRRQRARNERITERAYRRLALLRSLPGGGPADEPLIVHRTYADPRLLDITIDANDRSPGGTRGSPRAVNYGPNGMARYNTLTSWLSQWSVDSRASGPANLAKTTVPVLHVEYTADQSTFPSDAAAWSGAAVGRETHHRLAGATHYLRGQEDLLQELCDCLAAWLLAL
jgi:pimeloyl-ACP methyl ester carboxylesterase